MNYRERRVRAWKELLDAPLIFFPTSEFRAKLTRCISFTVGLIGGGKARLYAPSALARSVEEESESVWEVVRSPEPLGDCLDACGGEPLLHPGEPLWLLGYVKEWRDATPYLKKLLKKPFPGEVENIRGYVAKLDRAFEAVMSAASVGMTEAELMRVLNSELIKSGAEGFLYTTQVLFGRRTGLAFASPSGRALRKGDVIVVDAAPVFDGYALPLARTFLTEEREEVVRGLSRVGDALTAALEKMRPGVKGCDVDGALRERLKPHEMPHASGVPAGGFYSPLLTPDSEDVLEELSFLSLTGGFYGREFGIRVKHLVLVRERGAEIMERFGRV